VEATTEATTNRISITTEATTNPNKETRNTTYGTNFNKVTYGTKFEMDPSEPSGAQLQSTSNNAYSLKAVKKIAQLYNSFDVELTNLLITGFLLWP
jgi:hypothetical protein